MGENSKCIGEDTCPRTERLCTGGQVWTSCGSSCTKTCQEPNPFCTKQCVERCECPKDTPIWENGKCIAEEICPRTDNHCTGGQVWKSCGSACTKTCKEPNPVC